MRPPSAPLITVLQKVGLCTNKLLIKNNQTQSYSDNILTQTQKHVSKFVIVIIIIAIIQILSKFVLIITHRKWNQHSPIGNALFTMLDKVKKILTPNPDHHQNLPNLTDCLLSQLKAYHFFKCDRNSIHGLQLLFENFADKPTSLAFGE